MASVPMRRTALAIAAVAALATGCGTTVEGVGAGSTAGATNGLAAPTGAAASSLGGQGPVAGNGAAPGFSAPGAGTTTSGAGVGGTSSTSTSGGAPVVASAGPAGAANPTAPIKVGMLLTKTSNSSDYGVSLGNTINERDVDQALVQALHKRGGRHGP